MQHAIGGWWTIRFTFPRLSQAERNATVERWAERMLLLLGIRLAESKRALAQRINSRKGTISAGATARISLVIGTEKAIAPIPHERGRIGRMLHSAVGFLALEGVVALYVLIVVSPLVLVGSLVWAWRRRSIERLLAA